MNHTLFGEIEVTKRRKLRRITLRVSSTGKIKVSAPLRTPDRIIQNFVSSHQSWLSKQLDQIEIKTIETGDQIAHKYIVELVATDIDGVKASVQESRLIIRYGRGLDQTSREVQELAEEQCLTLLRKEAKAYLPARIKALSETTGLQFNQLRLKNTSSRWGSCSAKKNINLNIHLMNLPHRLIDHVIIHELCHTKFLNHTEDFWAEFKKHDENVDVNKKALRQYDITQPVML